MSEIRSQPANKKYRDGWDRVFKNVKRIGRNQLAFEPYPTTEKELPCRCYTDMRMFSRVDDPRGFTVECAVCGKRAIRSGAPRNEKEKTVWPKS